MTYQLDFEPSFVGNSRQHSYRDLLEAQKKIRECYPDKRVVDFSENNPNQFYIFDRGKVFLHYSKYSKDWDGVPVISIRADSKIGIVEIILELLDKDIELVFNPKSVKTIATTNQQP